MTAAPHAAFARIFRQNGARRAIAKKRNRFERRAQKQKPRRALPGFSEILKISGC